LELGEAMDTSSQPVEPLAMQHLRLWFGALNRTIAAAVARQNAVARELATRPLAAHAITPEHADALVESGADFLARGYFPLPDIALDSEEQEAEASLLTTAAQQCVQLPLVRLEQEAQLTAFERSVVLIVAAAELSPAHERLYGYLVDDLNRAHTSVDLVLLLSTGATLSEPSRRQSLGPAGCLRRLGLTAATELGSSTARTCLRMGHGVLDWLSGARGMPAVRLYDPEQIDQPEAGFLPDDSETSLAIALLSNGKGIVGVWGDGDRAQMAESLAARSGRALRRLALRDSSLPLDQIVGAALALAVGTEAILWLELADIADSGPVAQQAALAAALASREQPIILTAREPWRPSLLLRDGDYAELTPGPSASASEAEDLMRRARVDPGMAALLSGRHRFTASQRRTFAALTNKRPAKSNAAIEKAARLAAGTGSSKNALVVEPRRGPDDLVLPPTLHRQVLEIADFFVAASGADERWGFGHLSHAPGALKALFTGDPGTGKTLAAEVVAKQLGRQLFKVDLAQVVSKWVGETEKNLESLFEGAESANAVLFFDEADTLFGKRGEVRGGTDRYANLEVGYLLQRVESYRGLVILASNLRDEIDSAFVRRFQIVLNFPRPTEPERRRLWQLAFRHSDGSCADLDWEALVRIDLTGAGIVSSARLAVLLAVTQGEARPTMEHVRDAIARQYRQEARLPRGFSRTQADTRAGTLP
jgi:ATPase family associated with various cellular activities (AAA)